MTYKLEGLNYPGSEQSFCESDYSDCVSTHADLRLYCRVFVVVVVFFNDGLYQLHYRAHI